jgi:hypothetical protein
MGLGVGVGVKSVCVTGGGAVADTLMMECNPASRYVHTHEI